MGHFLHLESQNHGFIEYYWLGVTSSSLLVKHNILHLPEKKPHKLNHRIYAPSSHHSSWHFLPAHESYFWLNVLASVNIS